MEIILLNLWALCVLAIGQVVQFHDADSALADGIFSITTLSNYSILKIVFLFILYIGGGVLLALWRYRPFGKRPVEQEFANSVVVAPSRAPRWETALLFMLLVFVFIIPFITRDRLFTVDTLLNEDFFNLAAATTLRLPAQASGFPLYPYAFGPLVMFNALGSLFDAATITVSLLSALAVYGLYRYVRAVCAGPVARMCYVSIFLVLYHYVIFFPSFHRNLFRFSTPLFAAIVWAKMFNDAVALQSKTWIKFIIIWALVWFFSSADTLIITAVIYSMFAFSVNMRARTGRTVLYLLSAPVVGWCLVAALFGPVYSGFFSSQISSLLVYASHFNAVPYIQWSLESNAPWAYLKLAITTLIMFLPWILLFNLVIFLVKYFSTSLLTYNSRYGFITTLTVAYAVGFRQNFGEAGFSRITITSLLLVSLLPICSALKRNVEARRLVYGFYSFFILLFLVAIYFGRYSFIDQWQAHQKAKTRTGTISCDSTPFANATRSAGYVRCDTEIVDELAAIQKKIDKQPFFVYDDSPGLYYIFNSPAVAIAPSLYMKHALQQQLLQAWAVDDIHFTVVRNQPHFFGVPPEAENNPAFFTAIKGEMNNHWKSTLETKSFTLWQKK